MTMEIAIERFINATTESDLTEAYRAMLEWSDAPEGSEEDDVDAMLNARELPSMSSRLYQIAMDEFKT